MPGRNGQGPLGYGPATGRGMGWCRFGAGYDTRPRRGLFGRGFGALGFGAPAAAPADAPEALKYEAEELRMRLQLIEKRLAQLDKE